MPGAGPRRRDPGDGVIGPLDRHARAIDGLILAAGLKQQTALDFALPNSRWRARQILERPQNILYVQIRPGGPRSEFADTICRYSCAMFSNSRVVAEAVQGRPQKTSEKRKFRE